MANSINIPAVTVTTQVHGVISVTPPTPVQPIAGAAPVQISDTAGDPIISIDGALSVTQAVAPTYSAAVVNTTFNPGTDLLTISGSTTKTIKVYRMTFSAMINSTVNDMAFVSLVKRSTIDSGGAAEMTDVAHDSTSDPASAEVEYFVNPPTLGDEVGVIYSCLCPIVQNGNPVPDATPLSLVSYEIIPANMPIVLRGSDEILALNVSYTQGNKIQANIAVTWTEV